MSLKYPAQSDTNTFFVIKAYEIVGASISDIKSGKVKKAKYNWEETFILPLPNSGMVDAYRLNFDSAKTAGSDFNVSAMLAQALKSTGDLTGLGDMASMYSGRTVDPNVTPLFKGIQLRQFNLSWEIIPRSREDSEEIAKIVKQLKHFIKPGVEGDKRSSVLTFPAAFGLGVVVDGNEDPSTLPSFKGEGGSTYPNWVCPGISITYNGGGHWYNFDNGEPTMISINMEFQEMTKSSRDK